MGNISEYDMYLFGAGVHYDMYMKLGAHPCKKGRWQGVNFAVWAPNAKRVWVIGSFNDWNETSHEMKRLEPNGIYELFVSNVKIGDMYKYLIETQDGRKLYKADPYANYAEMRPGTASKVADISKLKWTDEKWMQARAEHKDDEVYRQPMSIYEVHPGSWKRHAGYDEDT